MCKKRVWQILIVLSVGLMMCLSQVWADAEKSGSQEKQEQKVLESIVVTAGRIKEKKSNVTTNITVFTLEDIEQSSIQDLSDLMLKEGFMIREYPNSLASVGSRGFRTDTHGNDLSNHVLVLVNGRRAGTGNISKISLDNVERVEIIRGPGSVQYGASAMGGVINVITKKGKDDLQGSVEGMLGSWEYSQTSASLSGSINRFDFSTSVSKASQGDYDTADGTHYYNTGFDAKESINFNGGFTFMPENRIGFTFSNNTGDHIGSPNYLIANNKVKYVDQGISSFDLTYDGQTQDDFLIWSLRYFQGRDKYRTFDPATSATKETYFKDTDSKGAQAQATAKWEMAHITAGMDWTGYAVTNTYTVAGKENTYENPAVFLLAKTELLDKRLVLSFGGRYDKFEVESDQGKTKDETNWSTSLGAVWKFFDGLSVRANYAEAFRMPTANELFMYTDYSAWGMGIWSGNEKLKPESSCTYEAGIDYTRGSLTGSLTYFYTQFEDKISYADIGGGVTQYNNIQGATISAVEASLQFDIGALFNWEYEIVPYGSFTAYTKYEDDATGDNLQYNPDLSASWGLKLNHVESGLSARLDFTHFGEHDITDYVGTGATKIPGNTVAILTVSKRLFDLEKYGKVTLTGEITNLFNKDYELVQGYPSPGRTFFLGLKYAF